MGQWLLKKEYEVTTDHNTQSNLSSCYPEKSLSRVSIPASEMKTKLNIIVHDMNRAQTPCFCINLNNMSTNSKTVFLDTPLCGQLATMATFLKTCIVS